MNQLKWRDLFLLLGLLISAFHSGRMNFSPCLAFARDLAAVYNNPAGDVTRALEDDLSEIDASPFTWRLKTALKNHFPASPDLRFRDDNQKSEAGLRLEASWTSAPHSLTTVTDAYFLIPFLNDDIRGNYPYSSESEIYRNLRISSRGNEMVFRELYINRDADEYRFRVGNQVVPWGTADSINPTAYFCPMDFREFILKDDAESRFGIPSVSTMVFFDEFTTELLFAPIHVPPALPSTGHFWAIKSVATRVPGFTTLPVELGNPEELTVSSRNFAYGGRLSTTFSGVDASISAYHGPDRDQLFIPYSISIRDNQPVLFMQPKSFVVDYTGFDVALTHGDFVFQIEGVFSPNRHGVVSQSPGLLPYDTRKSRFYACSFGFNYFIPMHDLISGHAGESLFTAEWYLARYDDNDVNRPLFSDFLTLRYEDGFFDDRLKVSMTQLLAARSKGMVWWPKIGYDFHNGFEMELAYISIYGRGTGDFSRDSLFYYYRDNDFVMLNFRYRIP